MCKYFSFATHNTILLFLSPSILGTKTSTFVPPDDKINVEDKYIIYEICFRRKFISVTEISDGADKLIWNTMHANEMDLSGICNAPGLRKRKPSETPTMLLAQRKNEMLVI